MSDYPAGVYAPRTKENKSGVVYTPANKTAGYAEDVTKLDDEVVAIETELGANPKGTKTDVVERLDDVDTDIDNRYTKDETDSLVGGANWGFFFTDHASDLANTYDAESAYTTHAENTLTKAGLVENDDQLIFRFATEVGQPTFDIVKAGLVQVQGTFAKTAGNRTVTLYAVLKEYKADTSEVTIATSEITGEITDKAPIIINTILAENYMLDADTSRLILEIYANVVGGSQATTVVSYQEGNTTSGFSVTTRIAALDTRYPTLTTFNDHSARHASGGDDPITDADIEVEKAIVFIIDGGGSAITTGIKGSIPIPFKCEITSVTMLVDQSGSIVVDIWKDTYANYPPTDADSITSSTPPTISSAKKDTDSTLTSWTKTITAGDILMFNVDSATTVEMATLTLHVKRIA